MEYARANASAEQVDALKHALIEFEEHGESRDSQEIAEKDFQFHATLWDLSGHPLLRDLLVQVSRPMFVFFRINWTRYRGAGLRFEEVAQAHQQIIDYLEGTTMLSAQACFRFSLRGGVIELLGEKQRPMSEYLAAT